MTTTEVLEHLQERLDEQEALLHQHRQQIAELVRERDLDGQPIPPPSTRRAGPKTEAAATHAPATKTSRRDALRKGALAVGAGVTGVAAATALGGPAEAATGDSMIVGQTNTASSMTSIESSGGITLRLTSAVGNGPTLAAIAPFTGQEPWAISASAAGGGIALVAGASGEAVGVRSSSRKSQLFLVPGTSTDPRTRVTSHARGMLVLDSGGNLWLCILGGVPGLWRKVSGPAAAGSVHVVNPTRVYDSRFVDGPIGEPTARQISVANGIDISTGAVTTPGIVPAGATSVQFNLAVVNTVGAGFLSVTPGDAGAFSAAAINWFATGQILNNGTQSRLDLNRSLKVWPGGTTDFIIDVTGFTL